ncbi:MAG: glycosyltransferase [bacterium]|nr:glycosyltransferase [bacterium]
MTGGNLFPVKLAVVIVHYNTSDDLARCLESLNAYGPPDDFRIVVVDNASRDEGLAEVHRRFPDCEWIFNADNQGYSRGCNRGLAAVEAEYYLLLNPDVVVKPGALARLLEFADAHPRAGIIGPQLLNEDGTIQHSCRRFYTFWTLVLRRTFLGRLFPDSRPVRRHLMQDFDHRSARPVDWLLGGCLLVRRSAVDRTGPMDERFFLYFEDVDWCYRMWRAGCEVLYTPDARFVHRHRRSSAQGATSRSFWLHLGSLISFYEKWGALVWLFKKWRDPLLLFVMWLLDMTGLAAAFGLAYGLRNLGHDLFPEQLYPFAEYRPLLLFGLLLATLTFVLAGRYRGEHLRRRRSVVEHLQQTGIVAVLMLASTYLGHLEVVSRAVLLMFVPLLVVFTALGDGLVRRVLRRLERGHLSLERTLLVGPAAVWRTWLDRAGDLAAQGVDVAGFVDDPGALESLPPLAGGTVPWLGRPAEAADVAERYRISQVVFRDLPPPGDPLWTAVGALRRMRVRLRWQGDGVWLLAAATRMEVFGGGLSAVQGQAGRRAAGALGRRLCGAVAGLLLGVAAALPWAWLRLVDVRQGRARIDRVTAWDRWRGGTPLVLALATDGQVKGLVWQWPLAWSLLTGRVAMWGEQARADGPPPPPPTTGDLMDFWRAEPAPPGLTGAWAAAGGGGRLRAICARLWRDPGGFGNVAETVRAREVVEKDPPGTEVE